MRCAVFLSFCALLACSSPRTALVVSVETDLYAPAEVRSVRADIGEAACSDGACRHEFATGEPSAFPFSFAVEPRAGRESEAFALTVTAIDGRGVPVVAQTYETHFVSGSTRLLRVRLARGCIGVDCADASTCVAGGCVASLVAPETLPEVAPGTELVDVDAALPDVPGLDVTAPVDGEGEALRSCAALPGVAPSGLTRIDPDGVGGSAPFDAYCENDADGGGWTLLLKIDPGTERLGYDAAEWTSPTPTPFGTSDPSLGDAVLLPYWTVPIDDLRVVIGDAAIVTRRADGAALGATLAALVSSGVALDASVEAWSRAASLRLVTACTRSGIELGLPLEVPQLRVRIGYVASDAADCTTPTLWIGVGASAAPTGSDCVASGFPSGAARLCGAPGMRDAIPLPALVYGR